MREAKFEFKLSGFIIALVLVAMFAAVFGTFITDAQTEYGTSGNHSFDNYDVIDQIKNDTETIRDSTDIEQQEGTLDVIGGYFSSGYAALKISLKSFGLFEDMIDDASNDVEGFAFFKPYIVTIVLVMLFIGVLITVLLKMRI